MHLKKEKSTLVLVFLTVAFTLLFAGGAQETLGKPSKAIELNPKETVVISGVEWGPPANFNPLDTSGHVSGKYQIVYENLFHYDLEKGKLTPWLAESGEWVSDTEYVVKLRKKVFFNDGQKFDADDVIYTFELGKKLEAVEWSGMWAWTKAVEKVDDHTVKFIFNSPHYHEFVFLLYRVPMIPEHVWSKIPDDKKMLTPGEKTIATGAYQFGAALDDKMIWERNDQWWGKSVFGPPPAKHVVFQIVSDNNVALGMVMKGEVDICNNYLPGLERVKDNYGLLTYYNGEPYNRSANVSMLYMNTEKPPMDKAAFRRAVAFAINPDLIEKNVYGGQVKAANPLGFMDFDFWMQYYDKDVVDKYGYTYDPQKAKALLDSIGLKDKNGDGYLENPDGSPINLKITVPSGWTDWMLAIQMISKSLKAVGIKATPAYPDFGLYFEGLTTGDFDMSINNFNSFLSPTPWTYWNCVLYDELDRKAVTFGNFGKYKNEMLFSLIDQFNETKIGSEEGKAIASKIQKIYLEDMPNIPIWYNGFWSTASTANWEGWPTEKENKASIATGWAYFYSLGAYEMLLNLKPSAAKK